MNNLKKLSFFLFAVLIGGQARCAEVGQAIEGSGHIIYKTRKTGKEIVINRDFSFLHDGCYCKIIVTNLPHGAITSSEYLNDGENIYLIDRLFTTNLDELKAYLRSNNIVAHQGREELPLTSVTAFNPANVTIKSLDDPQPAFEARSLLLPLWIAYASHCYYSENCAGGTGMVTRPFLPGEGVNRKKFPILANVKYLQDSNSFLQSVQYIGDGKEYTVKNDKVDIQPYREPFDRGFVEAAYNVISTTNIQGTLVPLKFEIKRMMPDPQTHNGAATNIISFTEMEATLDQVKVVRDFDPQVLSQEIPQVAAIFDRRFPASPQRDTTLRIDYEMTNGRIPELSKVEQSKDYKLAGKFKAETPDASKK